MAVPRFRHTATVRTPGPSTRDRFGDQVPGATTAHATVATIEQDAASTQSPDTDDGRTQAVRLRYTAVFPRDTPITAESEVDAFGAVFAVEGEPVGRPTRAPRFLAARLIRIRPAPPQE